MWVMQLVIVNIFIILKNCLRFDHFNYGNYSKAEYIFDKNKKIYFNVQNNQI